MAIKCVIFDMGGVVLSDKIEPVYDHLNKRLGKIVFKRDNATKRLVEGKVTAKEYYSRLSKRSGVPAKTLRAMFTEAYPRMLKVNNKPLAIAARLRKNGYKAGLISTVAKEQKEINQKRGAHKPFRPVVLSCDVGYVKPHPKLFSIFLKKARVLSNECVYIDDRKPLLAYPKKIGMKVIHFRNPAQLTKDLRKLGVRI